MMMDERKRAPLIARAAQYVTEAQLRGLLPDLRLAAVRCTDCPNTATQWDHRDYRKPLAVEPVCKGCNLRRGPGKPYPRMWRRKPFDPSRVRRSA